MDYLHDPQPRTLIAPEEQFDEDTQEPICSGDLEIEFIFEEFDEGGEA